MEEEERLLVDHGHLGGYVAGGDPATWFPEMWSWLVQDENVRFVLDVGCGEGHSTRYFAELGCYAVGVEGVPQDNPLVVQHDYVNGSWDPRGTVFDLAWCCEFLEHVDERYLPNLSSTFQAARMIAMTHAFPDQEGHHHVNCRTEDYWRGYFAGLGYAVNDGLTGHARGLAKLNTDPLNHFVRSGLILVRQ